MRERTGVIKSNRGNDYKREREKVRANVKGTKRVRGKDE